MAAIRVENVSKAYRCYAGRWSRLLEWTLPVLGARHQQVWVVRDVSFSVWPGEAVGIVGMNGAGKSTLLKMIAGTTVPTHGQIFLRGRVAALLELGLGFHPDFTGRQNLYMAGQLMGLSSDFIDAQMPEIEAFAEVGDYLDKPVRVYSSGMQMRLAFSIATAQRPDILIVDEALSVGDSYFQHKSFDRIRQFRQQGTTLLLVSHDKSAIQSICDRAILLHEGRLALEGEPDAVLDYYNALLAQRGDYELWQQRQEGVTRTFSGTGEACLLHVGLLDENNRPLDVVAVGQRVCLRIVFRAQEALPEVVLGYQIRDRLGQAVFGTNTAYLNQPLYHLAKDETVEYRFYFEAMLGEGSYTLSVALHTSESHVMHNYAWHDMALMFSVVNSNQKRFVGVAWLPPTMECLR
ncbi:ABC transporter ATP-binding protein [Desulfuromonas thiophila]|uniref:Lipopolysaccharide transport system ATP-binding protein n=1 Tax=Desulfuromonas thiophila TaxID=57664 RepID=A0A1G7BVI3_9BACT|nr:ABC transporter ATP-binding protein [Desulfuromonas thiophila]SDE30386.1 lipopolysaccharide transport system ATP-binding protein [Desulfuromonas thiophila]